VLPAFALTTADSLLSALSESRAGDYSVMKKEKVVCVLIRFSTTSYPIDNGKEKGVAVEYMRMFEALLNKGIKKEIDKIRVVLIPTRRGDLRVLNHQYADTFEPVNDSMCNRTATPKVAHTKTHRGYT